MLATSLMTCLLYGADGDTCRTGHDEVTVLDVGANLIQHKRDDVWLDGQEENIAFADRLFVAGGEIDAQFLKIIIIIKKELT